MALIPDHKLRNINNSKITSGLFWEEGLDKERAFFTFTDKPKNGLVPFRDVFLEYCLDDPSEYTFAIEVFGSWEHWLKICRNKRMLDKINEVREELQIAIESRAVKEIMEEAISGKAKFQAAKFLVQKGYITKMPKAHQAKTVKVSDENSVQEDLKRLLGK